MMQPSSGHAISILTLKQSVTAMSISNELSGEIVTAVLNAKERSPEELQELKKMLIEVHATLQQMADYERRTIGNQAHKSEQKAMSASASELNQLNRGE